MKPTKKCRTHGLGKIPHPNAHYISYNMDLEDGVAPNRLLVVDTRQNRGVLIKDGLIPIYL